MTTFVVKNPGALGELAVNFEDGAIVDAVGVDWAVLGRAEELADEGYTIYPGVEEPGVRLGFDSPAQAALTIEHAARTVAGGGAPISGWFGYSLTGELVVELPPDVFDMQGITDASRVGDLAMPPG
jgi:hypothetical protein